MEPALNIAVVGLGDRSVRIGLPCIIECPLLNLIAVCDLNIDTLTRFSTNREMQAFTHIEALLAHRQKSLQMGREQDIVQAAYVALPHHQYGKVVTLLLQHGIHVLKEKPAGIDTAELSKLQLTAMANKACLFTASQSRFSERLYLAQRHIPSLGTLRFIEGTRKVSVPNLADGWRSKSVCAGGGAVNDIGWHLLDEVVGFVGSDAQTNVPFVTLFHTRASKAEDYDCEDSAHIALEFQQSKDFGEHTTVSCNLRISRIGGNKVDEIVLVGDQASLTLHRDAVIVQFAHSSQQQIHKLGSGTTTTKDFQRMLEHFHACASSTVASAEHDRFARQDVKVTEIIKDVYRHWTDKGGKKSASSGKHQILSEHSSEPLKYHWPKITKELEQAVVHQLHKNISIYDNSGIFGTFERLFLQVHQRPEWYALLHNSGTNALQALFYAAGFLPGDEIIFPVYTFHATASAAMHFGITPIFCDCLPDGNISPPAIAEQVNSSTKAVVVTHMWGLPCDMPAILSLLPQSVLLLEDCSHAIGASINGQLVGTFGDGAAWSLQGQKNVSGGEGGIVVTKHDAFHYRQLLWGHYNKRCKSEIPSNHELHPYALTGAGSKNRAHPIAVAIAMNQLQKLHVFQSVRHAFATRIVESLRDIPFLRVAHSQVFASKHIYHSWYALILLFDQATAPAGLTREGFVSRLLSRGLVEVDIPNSTKPIHEEPLFLSPHKILPHIFRHPCPTPDQKPKRSFRQAQTFYRSAIKLPLWAYPEDAPVVDHYTSTIRDAALTPILHSHL